MVLSKVLIYTIGATKTRDIYFSIPGAQVVKAYAFVHWPILYDHL